MRPGRPKPPPAAVMCEWWMPPLGPVPRLLVSRVIVTGEAVSPPRAKPPRYGKGEADDWPAVEVAAGQLLGWRCPATRLSEVSWTWPVRTTKLTREIRVLGKAPAVPFNGPSCGFLPSGQLPPVDQPLSRLLRASRRLQGASVAYRVTHPAAYGLQVAREPCSRASNT